MSEGVLGAVVAAPACFSLSSAPGVSRTVFEPESEIDGGSEPEFGGGWNGQHGLPSNPRRTATIISGRVSAGNRRTVPDGNASSMGVAGA